MNYYSHHIGDYLSATAHLTLLEHGAYRRLIDVYYIHERPLPGDNKQVYRLVGARTKEEKDAVDTILEEFFESSPEGWRQSRCDHEIGLCNKNRNNGSKGGRPKKTDNPDETQKKPKQNPDETQEGGEQDPKQKAPHHPITPSPHHPSSISEEAASTSTTGSQGPCGSSSSSPAPLTRGGQILALYFALEHGRGKEIGYVLPAWGKEWADRGITDDQIRQAHSMAVAAREKAKDGSPINPKYLDVFISKILADVPESAVGYVVKKEWHDSNAAVEEKAKELGMSWLKAREDGISWTDFKANVIARAGMVAPMELAA